jgi:hypothetical protein
MASSLSEEAFMNPKWNMVGEISAAQMLRNIPRSSSATKQ